MATRRYVIVGGGMAADAAAQALHEADASGQITILSAEEHPPYSRPPLSKALWKGEPFDSIWRGTEKTGARILTGHHATAIDRKQHTVTDSQGETHPYDALLLATGGTPIRLPTGGAETIYYRTADDYRSLRQLTENKKRFAVIGGGFIGSEIAAALRMNGKDVVLLFPEDGLCGRVFPADLALAVTAYYREKGVDVRSGTSVARIESSSAGPVVVTAKDERIAVDAVVGGIGIRPNVDLAQAAGLAVDNGVVVNERLQTSDPNIFAAGDIARFPAHGLNRLLRVEHEDAALSMGHAAGLAMAGQDVRYTHLPFFYSDLFELGYEAVGLIDSRLKTEAQWKTKFKEGIVYYLEGDKVRGVLLVNTWGLVDKARQAVVDGLSVAETAKLLA